jgi:hypothetical protein
MRALEILGKYFFALFLSFSDFLCEASGRCVSKRLDGAPICPDSDFGCPDDTVDSSGCPFFLFERVCFCDLLRGIPFGRHLSSVWTMNLVGLNRILPGAAHHFLLSFGSFCRLVHFFSILFMRTSQVHVSSLQFISTPCMFLYSFTNLF